MTAPTGSPDAAALAVLRAALVAVLQEARAASEHATRMYRGPYSSHEQAIKTLDAQTTG